ncbi:MAG: hypothetical protein PHX30_00955 [Candidatus Pacebacteria bacterium]|nr:hypothetical protein [Candidatus Paceibacterota bacterium]
MVIIFALIAAIGFLLVRGSLQDSSNPQSSFNNEKVEDAVALFSDFKACKEKVLSQYVNNSHNPVSLPEESQFFCWNKEKETFEKTDFGLTNENPDLSRDRLSKTQSADLDSDGINEEYILQGGKLTIRGNAETIWQSADDWWVEDFAIADSTNDGVADINLSVWKSGSFGKFKPIWVKNNDPSVKNHFFIFNWEDGKIKPVWQSSNLDAPNCQILIDDINDDGENEIIVLEGDYADVPDCSGKYIAVWKWGEWGFLNEWRSEEGEFEGMGVEEVGENKCFIGF